MPIYQYRCETCKNDWERLDGYDSFKSKRKCPECGSMGKTVITSPGKHINRFEEGWDDSVDRYFGTQRERDAYLRDNGLRLAD